MKKKLQLGIPAAALFLLASCSSEEILQENPNPSGQPYISFNGLVQNNTRAGETSVDDIKKPKNEGGGFMVKAFEDGRKIYFDFQKATFQTKHGVASFWTDNDYYWPGSPLCFAAYYPTDNLEWTINSNNIYSHTYNFKESDFGINGRDIVVAVSKITHPSSWTESHPLTFNHMFAQICVAAKSIATKYTLDISKVKICNIPSEGSFSGDLYIYGNSNSDFSWNDINMRCQPGSLSVVSDFSADVPTNKQTIANNLVTLVGADASGKRTNGFFVQRQIFDAIDESEDESTRLKVEKVGHSWDGTKDDTGAYLAVKIKLTQLNEDGSEGNVFYEGWSAIPAFDQLSIKSGHRYIFNLTFTDTGAGQVPPGEPDGGEYILGEPIHFTVDCDEWDKLESNEPLKTGTTQNEQ